MNQPDYSAHVLKSLTDDSWIREYAEKMGEVKLYEYKNQVYNLLYNLEVGKSISIDKWVKPENVDLFIKIACCFCSESKASYYFYENYTIIKHTFDAYQMEKTLALLERKRRETANREDGGDTGSNNLRTEAIPAPASDV